ncbi:MAG: AAA family ATPase, partial [Chloroflexi bacterium]|nr:AAA family ATPase [Chloroflexota bacterium]MBU1749328.1 AAA family ATPase [Chloroflexota bacterium]
MSNTPRPSQPDNDHLGYLPEHLQTRAAGDAGAYGRHLQDVLRTVLTYLPQYVAQARLADPAAPAVAGSFAHATLLFADIAGFTAMSERLTQLGREGAEVITGIVNEYFAVMLDIMARHGGDLFKFGGDAILVCFQGDDGAARGCRTALEMQEAMARFSAIETAQGTFSLRMTAALGTGRLFLVSLGAAERLEFAVMGPAVVQVAQAEDLAEAGEVLVDQATYKAAGPAAIANERAPGFYHLTALATPDRTRYTAPAVSFPDPSDADRLVARLDTLSPYLPPEIVARIVADPDQPMIEGEHRPVTVLFANFYGINAIIEALGPDRADELTAILNRHFIAMQDVIHQYGGIVNKVDSYAVGYRIMALFGAPVAHEDDPARAVYAAIEMQEALSAFADLTTSAGGFTLKQRIGVNTGHVFAGTLGSALRREYSVMGDEVNLTSRLMGVAAEGQVLVSQSTARRVEGLFELMERDLVRVKGKAHPVRSYQARRRIAGRAQRPAAAREVFVGRQVELGAARALVDAALTGQGATLDVAGDAGVGKTRLIAELSHYADEQGMASLRGEAVSYGRNLPYLPWIGVLRRLLGLKEDGGDRQERLVAGLDRAGLSDWSPIVGTVLGIEVPETPLTASLDAQLRQQRFFDVVLSLLQQRADRAPLLLVLDDMQWADAASLDLVTYVARNVRTWPILLVLVHRPDLAAPPWCAIDECHTLRLGELDEVTSLALVHSVLGDAELAPALQR